MTHIPVARRAFLTGALSVAALPAFAQTKPPLEDRGYALGDVALGSPDAPVTIIEYASLTCPHCAAFHNQTFPAIKEKYIDTGKARFVFRDVYFDQYGLWGAMIARCGGEGPFLGYVATLFERQREWVQSEDRVAALQRIGRLGGLSADRMNECLRDEDFLKRLVADYQSNATADGVQATPTFIINGEKVTGDMSVADFSALIDKHLS